MYGGGVDIDDVGGFMSAGGKALLEANDWASLEPKFAECAAFLTATTRGATTIGGIGFCWGAWACVHMSGSAAPPSLKAIASCHPSIMIAHKIFTEVEEELVAAMTGPMLLCTAGNDAANVKPDGALVSLSQSKFPATDAVCFEEMSHGWSIRGDASIAEVARDVKAAIDRCCAFFAAQL